MSTGGGWQTTHNCSPSGRVQNLLELQCQHLPSLCASNCHDATVQIAFPALRFHSGMLNLERINLDSHAGFVLAEMLECLVMVDVPVIRDYAVFLQHIKNELDG